MLPAQKTLIKMFQKLSECNDSGFIAELLFNSPVYILFIIEQISVNMAMIGNLDFQQWIRGHADKEAMTLCISFNLVRTG